MLRTDGCTDGRTHARTDNMKTVNPPQTKFAGGINIFNTVAKTFEKVLRLTMTSITKVKAEKFHS